MAASNFETMRDFSLYVRDCEDDFWCFEADEIEDVLENFNHDLLFHTVKLQSGYYDGVQLLVDVEYDLAEDDYDNEECHYYFDCCRSVAYRKYRAEINKINRMLDKLADAYGFTGAVCVARFSNGEAMFAPLTKRTRLYAAVNA